MVKAQEHKKNFQKKFLQLGIFEKQNKSRFQTVKNKIWVLDKIRF